MPSLSKRFLCIRNVSSPNAGVLGQSWSEIRELSLHSASVSRNFRDLSCEKTCKIDVAIVNPRPGHRQCVDKSLALTEIRLAVATLLRKFEVSFAADQDVEGVINNMKEN